jgi:tetratricopeptide (TPR) repeat protein
MARNVVALLLIVLFSRPGWSSSDEVEDALAKAEALYFEAQFAESIKILQGVDEMLRAHPEKRQERISVKLQLALAHIGLNDPQKAKSLLNDLYAIDPDYSLDAQQFSPKVTALAEQAKAEQAEIRCETARTDAGKRLAEGNAKATFDLVTSMKDKCDGLSGFEPELAELFYKLGADAFKRNDLPVAMQDFQATLKLAPKHDLAIQYMDLTKTKLQLTADRIFLQWQKNFDAGLFSQAAADYRLIVSLNDEANTQMIADARNEYRNALTKLVESYNQGCMRGDESLMDRVKIQISDLLPDPSFGEDIRDQMTTCTKNNGCLQMNSVLAMARLKTRVNPQINAALVGFMHGSQVTVRVRARIDEAGNVNVSETEGGNPSVSAAVRSAVEMWKFNPIIDQTGVRCVDTEIPIFLRF